MTDQKFSIQQKIFEIATFSKDNVYEIHNRVSGLVNNRLADRIGNYFNAVIPGHQVLQLDQLQLDLGEVSLEKLEQEIEERFMDALEKDIAYRLSLLDTSVDVSLSQISSSTLVSRNEKLLQYFLQYGTLPWWSPADSNFSIGQVFDELVAADPGALKNVLQGLGKNENNIRRIVHTFSEERLMMIVRLAEPGESEYILNYYQQVSKLQNEKQVVKSDLPAFKKAAWVFIFNYLLVDKESVFSKKMFLKSNLQQLAAHYNIRYFDLLQVFYTSMDSILKSASTNLLQLFIEDLYIGETALNKVEDVVETANRQQVNTANYLSHVELLEYYLHFGTLPHAYDGLTEKEVASILSSMAYAFPDTVKKIIRSTGTDATYKKRLFEMTGPEGIKELFKLVFPEAEKILLKIAAIFNSLQHTHAFVKTSRTSFDLALWKYLLEAVAISGTGAIEKAFVIRHVIKGLEREFADKPYMVWSILDAALLHPLPEFSGDNDTIHIFKKLVNETSTAAERGGQLKEEALMTDAIFDQQTNKQRDQVYAAVQVKDVLRYLLQYGSIPWWGKEYFVYSIPTLLEELFLTDRDALTGLVRQAGRQPNMKERVMANMPAGMALKLLHGLPLGNTALDSINRFYLVLDATGLLRYHDEEFIKKILLSIAWDILTDNGYRIFPEMIFYFELVHRFSKLLKIGIKDLAVALKKSSIIISDTSEYLRVQLLMNMVYNYFNDETASDIMDGPPVTDTEDYANATARIISASKADPGPQQISLFSMQPYFDTNELTPVQLLDEALAVLLYFLTWNSLPDRFTGFDKSEQLQLIRQILILCFENDRMALNNTIREEGHSPAALAYLGECVLESAGGTEKALYFFIQEHVLRGIQIHSHEQEKRRSFTMDDVDATAGSLEDIVAEAADIDDQKRDISTTAYAEMVLKHFIENEQLPGYIRAGDKGKADGFLKKLLLHLYSENPAAFEALFKRETPCTAAKLHLYDLFAIGSDSSSIAISRLLDKSRNDTMIDYLLKNGKGYDLYDKEGLEKMVLLFLNDTKHAETFKKLNWLYSSPSFAEMILETYGMTLFLQLVTYKLQITLPGSLVVEQLLAFLQRSLQNNLDRKKAIELFKRFNIIFISGRVYVNTEADYTTAFFKYLLDNMTEWSARMSTRLFEFTGATDKMLRSGLQAAVVYHEEKRQSSSTLRKKEEADLANVLEQDIMDYRNKQLDLVQQQTDIKTRKMNEKAVQDTGSPAQNENTCLYINNAGLILFHPFLLTYFERVGLLENMEFVNREARDRAVLLLQYLAKGPGTCDEHELVLNKILCAVPISETISTLFSPTQQEIDVTDELYEVFIEQWAQMKNTSVESIRHSFLLRNGVLKWDDEYWKMRVEQRGYDIILQTLPWAFGMIKTPMMDKVLMVEWI